jgi:hypothetical protein
MCGIVGIVSKSKSGLFSTDLDLFEEMLVCDSLRGLDSTGVFGVYKNHQASTLKVAAEPHSLFRCEEWGKFRTKAINSMNMVVGHNRSATKGAVSTTNAHPFSEGKIVLVHNGTLHNHKDFNKDVEVDSHAITHALNERPAKEVLKEIDGAFAFVWYDREQAKLFIARNSERPLSFIETSTQVVFASEGSMLDWLMNRKYVKNPAAETFPVGELISFDLNGNKETDTFELFRPKYQGYTHTGNSRSYAGMGASTRLITMKTPRTDSGDSADKRLMAGTPVLLKVDTVAQQLQNGTIKVTGKMVYPYQGIDVAGILTRDLNITDAHTMVRLPFVEATVQAYHNSNCGPSYYVNNVSFSTPIQVYNTTIPYTMWKHVCAFAACDKCGNSINSNQPQFTSIKMRGNSKPPRVVCADCVCESLNNAIDTNIKDCNDAISARKPFGKIPEIGPEPRLEEKHFMC